MLSVGGRGGHRADLRRFLEKSDVKVLLLSTQAGGAGLTLVQANHVYLLEPSLDPALEQQAMARVHRIGQTRAVRCTRFIVRGTVDEAVLAINRGRQSRLYGGDAESKKRDREFEEDQQGLGMGVGAEGGGGGDWATTLSALAPTSDSVSDDDVARLLDLAMEAARRFKGRVEGEVGGQGAAWA